jgi:hypothetical protein
VPGRGTQIDIDESLPHVLADPELLERVLLWVPSTCGSR